MYAGIRHFFAPEEFAQRLARAPQRNGFRRNSEFCQLCQYLLIGAASVHTLYRAQVYILAYGIPVAFVQAFGKVNLTYHGGQHMAVLQVEVIVGSIQVGRHHRYVVRAVLQVEAFAHFQSGNLGNGIRFVGIFQRRCQQHFLFHRLRSFTRIDAGTAQEEQLLYSVSETFTNHILLYL